MASDNISTYGQKRYLQILIIATVLISLISADLPSCYRARCSHCSVPFIAKMCSSVCSTCNNYDSTTDYQSPKIRPGIAQRKVETIYANGARLHGQPINVPYEQSNQISSFSAQQRGPAYETYQANTAPFAHQLPTEEKQPEQTNYANNNNYAQQSPSYSLSNQATGFGSSYTPYNNQPQQQSPYYPQFQPQQVQNSFNPFYNPQPQQPFGSAAAQTFRPAAPAQQNTLFTNPFQPFLQQTYQSQQYQGFTPAPPMAFTPFPPFTMPTFPPLPTVTPPSPAQQQQIPQFGQQSQIFVQPQQSSQYSQPRVVQPIAVNPAVSANNNQYAYKAQPHIPKTQPQQVATPEYARVIEKPKQIYNQPNVYTNNNNIPPQSSLPQSGPTQQPESPQIATNIDASSIYQQNKNGKYEENNKGTYPAAETCPKQPGWEPCISKELANERFRTCCTPLGEGCTAICSYDQPLATLQLAVLTGRCPVAKVADVMLCASGYVDASACCQAYGVFEPGFEHCRPYCNPAGGLPNDGMLAEKYRCLGKLAHIQRCFYVSQKP